MGIRLCQWSKRLYHESIKFWYKGTVIANTYYYEEGNIQFNLQTDFDEKLAFEITDEKSAKDIIELIKAREDRVFKL